MTPREHPAADNAAASGQPGATGRPGAAVGLLARSYALVVVSLRLLIIGGWAGAVAAAIIFLPPLNPNAGGLSELIPPGSPAAHAESDASRLFGFPLDAAAAVVQRDPRAITTAGVALAASFAMLAVIPLEQFRQLAITMAVGVILDAIVVRSLMVPALVALFGRLGMWPGNRRRPQARVQPRVSAGAGQPG